MLNLLNAIAHLFLFSVLFMVPGEWWAVADISISSGELTQFLGIR